MKDKRKIFGMGVVVLFTALAFHPITNAYEPHAYEPPNDFIDEMNAVFEANYELINNISYWINQTIQSERLFVDITNDELFANLELPTDVVNWTAPEDFQALNQTMVSEDSQAAANMIPEYIQTQYNQLCSDIENVINQYQETGGGINGFSVSVFVNYPGVPRGFGWLYKIWWDDYWTGVINFWGPLGIVILAVLITAASGGLAAAFAIAIAGYLIGFGINTICNANQGNGIWLRVFQYFVPHGWWWLQYGPQ